MTILTSRRARRSGDPRGAGAPHVILTLCGALAFLLGTSTIYGWLVHDANLLQIRPQEQWVAMAFNTGVSFALTGLALLCLAAGRIRLLPLLVAFPFMAGSLNLVEHLTGVEIGIDQLLLRQDDTPIGWAGTGHPGRMAPQTCVCWLLTSLALLVASLPARPARRPAFLGSIGSILVAMGVVGACGYLLGVDTYHWIAFHPIAVHTAAGMTLLGAGLIAAGWREDPERPAMPAWLPLPVAAAVASVTLCLNLALSSGLREQLPRLTLAVGFSMAILCGALVHLLQSARRNLELARRTAERLLAATREIQSASATQTRGIGDLDSSVRETTRAVTEITQASDQVSAFAASVGQSVQDTVRIGQAGREQVNESIEAMGLVRSEVQEIVERVRNLSRVLGVLTEVVENVDRVAIQTKILSVNAAIEACSAEGRGAAFGVIALEVGSLADLSSEGSREIQARLREIDEANQMAVDSARRGVATVERAAQVIAGARQTIESLSTTLARTAEVSELIRGAARDQAAAVARIQHAMHTVEGTTGRSVESIRELQATAEHLSALSDELTRIAGS